MKEITKEITTEKIISMVRSGDTQLYVRWSSGPEIDRNGCSKDYSANTSHAEYTLSANPLVYQDRVDHFEYGFWVNTEFQADLDICESFGLRKWIERACQEYSFLPGKPWIMRAQRVGTDSDNAALVDSRNFEFIGYWTG